MGKRIKGYERFAATRRLLCALLERTLSLCTQLDMSAAIDTVRKLNERVTLDTFKVLVLGEFKRGKSTFINALLGQEVLPAYATPCTAVINEVRWGEAKQAVLYFSCPLPENLPQNLPDAVVDHLRKHSHEDVPSLRIPFDQLQDYVVIPDPAKDQASSIAEVPYKRVEIFWPTDLCQNGVVLIDSPGLNEHRTRTSITRDYLSEADAIIFVMSCHSLVSQSEIRVLDRDILGTGHEHILFVCNRFDEIHHDERPRLIEFAKTELGEKTCFGPNGIYFISALEALEGQLTSNADRVARSGMPEFEQHLETFLTQERGKVKLLQPSRRLLAEIERATKDYIPSQLAMLDDSLVCLQKQYESMKPELENAEARRRRIMGRIDRSRTRIRDDFRRELRTRIRELSGNVPHWVETYSPKSKISFTSLQSAKQQAKQLIVML